MGKDLALDMILTEWWSNNACRSHVIWAMEDYSFKPENIKRVVREFHWVSDMKSIEEADEHYRQSPYQTFLLF